MERDHAELSWHRDQPHGKKASACWVESGRFIEKGKSGTLRKACFEMS